MHHVSDSQAARNAPQALPLEYVGAGALFVTWKNYFHLQVPGYLIQGTLTHRHLPQMYRNTQKQWFSLIFIVFDWSSRDRLLRVAYLKITPPNQKITLTQVMKNHLRTGFERTRVFIDANEVFYTIPAGPPEKSWKPMEIAGFVYIFTNSDHMPALEHLVRIDGHSDSFKTGS